MAWIYRLSSNSRDPDPTREIAHLAEVARRDGMSYLLLEDRQDPPLSGPGVRAGDVAYLATATSGGDARRLILHGLGRLGGLRRGPTPESVLLVYGAHRERLFRELSEIELFERGPLAAGAVGLSPEDEARFLAGQATAKELAHDPRLVPEGIYGGLTEDEIDEIESIILGRDRDGHAGIPG